MDAVKLQNIGPILANQTASTTLTSLTFRYVLQYRIQLSYTSCRGSPTPAHLYIQRCVDSDRRDVHTDSLATSLPPSGYL